MHSLLPDLTEPVNTSNSHQRLANLLVQQANNTPEHPSRMAAQQQDSLRKSRNRALMTPLQASSGLPGRDAMTQNMLPSTAWLHQQWCTHVAQIAGCSGALLADLTVLLHHGHDVYLQDLDDQSGSSGCG